MRVCIRRGAKEIGGSAVELTASDGTRLIVDLGLPLDAPENTVDLLPNIKGLKSKTDDLLGILISHPHQDHYGLIRHIDRTIPIYMSKATASIMDVCINHHLPDAFAFGNIKIFDGQKSFNIGAFTITPYLVDHSAYGAYAFLIEADGKRLFYSGDFRSHGRKNKLFNAFIKNPPQNTDILMLEGSCLGREQSDKYQSEQSLQAEFEQIFKATKGMCFIQASSQNIDRIVTIYNAAKKNGRMLVMSGYTGHILMALDNPHLPQFTWPDVKKFATDSTVPYQITKEMMEDNPEKYVIMLGGKIFNVLNDSSLINENAVFIYSMWNGYKELYQKRLDLMKAKNVPIYDVHTSGHADILTLQKFAAALNPKCIVPIHTFFPEKFKEMFNNVELHADDEEFEV